MLPILQDLADLTPYILLLLAGLLISVALVKATLQQMRRRRSERREAALQEMFRAEMSEHAPVAEEERPARRGPPAVPQRAAYRS